MPAKKEGKDIVSFVLGIISIVLAFFNPLPAIVFGIIGLVESKDEKSQIAKKAKKLNILGIIIGSILFLASVVLLAISANEVGPFEFPSAV